MYSMNWEWLGPGSWWPSAILCAAALNVAAQYTYIYIYIPCNKERQGAHDHHCAAAGWA